MIDWKRVREGCPRCGAQIGGPRGVHYNGASIWCLGCGWGQNWPDLARDRKRGEIQ